MPAYTVELDHPCDRPGCQKRAVVRVMNSRNERLADYCRPHGNQRVDELNRGGGGG